MLPPILQAIQRLGYVVFQEGPYDLNLFGIRNEDSVATNAFDDLMGCAYQDETMAWHVEFWPATTDPGLYWLRNPGGVKGTAILVPGQYRGTHRIDKHGGAYDAICQRSGPVRVYRDRNRDAVIDLDPSSIDEGFFGINLHHASYTGASTQVEKWSAGCQVIADIRHFNRMMTLARLQQKHHPTWSAYSYTLLTSGQLRETE